MCATVTKIAAVLALIGAIAVSAVAISLTVGKAADACALRAHSYADRAAPLSAQDSKTLTIFDRDCLDWSPAGSNTRSDWLSPF